jgi:hypothetical protein
MWSLGSVIFDFFTGRGLIDSFEKYDKFEGEKNLIFVKNRY